MKIRLYLNRIKLIITITAAVFLCFSTSFLTACTDDNQPERSNGSFLTLSEAFNKGMLTNNDLLDIAYYSDCIGETVHTPSPLTPSTLSENTKKDIKASYLGKLKKDTTLSQEIIKNASIDNIVIHDYYGTYNKCIVISITDDLFRYDYTFKEAEKIGDVTFYNYCQALISVWKQG